MISRKKAENKTKIKRDFKSPRISAVHPAPRKQNFELKKKKKWMNIGKSTVFIKHFDFTKLLMAIGNAQK